MGATGLHAGGQLAVNSIEETIPDWKVWLVAVLAGLSVAWPLLFASLLHGPGIMLRSLAGDSYQ